MGWLIALGILILLAILPLGASVIYDDQGPLIRLILGPIRLKLFPKKKKQLTEKQKRRVEEKAQAKKLAKEQKKAQKAEEKKQQKARVSKDSPKKGGSFTDFLPLVKMGINFLGDFRRKLRVNVLNLKLIMAGGDPCDLAVNYGKAWAAVGNLMPYLDRIFVIKKRDVELECDFTADKTLIYARLDISITLGRLIKIVVYHGVKILIKFLKIMNQRKGGAKV